MSKPELIDVLTIVALKAEAAAIYEEIDQRAFELVDEFGVGRFDYDLEDAGVDIDPDLLEGGRYLKFETADNVARMSAGETVWKSVPFKRFSVSTGSLKRQPASLKGGG